MHVGAAVEVDTGQRPGAEDRRNREQKRKAHRFRALEPEEAGRRHGDARAAGSGNERQHLHEADEHGAGRAQVLDPAHGQSRAVGDQEQNAEPDRGPGDDLHVAQACSHRVLEEVEEVSGHDQRDARQHDVEGETGAGSRLPDENPGQPDDDLRDVAPEIQADGEQGADVHRDVEDQAVALGLLGHLPAGAVEVFPDQHQVARRADRQELGEPLDDGEDEDMKQRQNNILGARRPSPRPRSRAA